VDVVPVVYLDARSRGAACAEALLVADRIGAELGIPVFLYGELTGTPEGGSTGVGPVAGKPQLPRTRAELRSGGLRGLAKRMASGEQRPDFGPSVLHPTAGAVLVAAREPLVAFNLELAQPATLADARRIAGLIREGGAEGLPGLRAIGVALHACIGVPGETPVLGELSVPEEAPMSGEHPSVPLRSLQDARTVQARMRGLSAARLPVAQVSMNVEYPLLLPLARVVEAVARHAEVAAAEIVGLAPRAALKGFPEDLPLPGFDPERQILENALEGGAGSRRPTSRALDISS
jgi:glutamate formiminotransferase / 5-formyltetrahydrofolate cyclo-ligase